MALTTMEIREAKALTLHEADEMAGTTINMEADVEAALKAVAAKYGLEDVLKAIAKNKEKLGVRFDKKTTDLFRHRIKFGAESERISIPTASAKDLYINDPEEFARLHGEVKIVKGSFLGIERIK